MGRVRLNFLDWLRALLVWCVVFAHLTFCGLPNRVRDLSIDDHAWFSPGDSYEISVPGHNYKKGGPEADSNMLGVRYNAIMRQWCIPLLLWVSGAASALSFNGSMSRLCGGAKKIALITVVGVAGNAFCWLAGPQNEKCSIAYYEERTDCNGILFDFTEDPFGGDVEPYVNQMWYTFALLILMFANIPLFKVLIGQGGPVLLLVQWLYMAVLYIGLVVAGGETFAHPIALAAFLCVFEAAFLAVAALATIPGKKPAWLPLRSLHYVCAGISVVQMAGAPIGDVSELGLPFLVYMLVGVARWFQLGFVMTRPRVDAVPVDAPADYCAVEPLVSRAWPLTLFIGTFVAPSTNWFMAGVLPYPYLPHSVDRYLYTSGTVFMFFLVDRVSHNFHCDPLPDLIGNATLILYVLQITLITLLVQFGMRSIVGIWMACSVIALVVAAPWTFWSASRKRSQAVEAQPIRSGPGTPGSTINPDLAGTSMSSRSR